MTVKQTVKIVSFVFLAGALLASGCARKGKTRGAGQDEDLIDTTSMAGDLTMDARADEAGLGTRIEDVAFENVLFAYDSYQIDTSEVSKIEAVASYMRDNADVTLVVEGNCDERGSSEYNMALGENRAQAVRAYLISLGIDGGRIQTRSFGEDNPLDPGHGEEAWRVNRRGEFALYR